jgi:hypothetical protein
MEKKRFMKRIPTIYKIISACMILLILVFVGLNLAEGKNVLLNDPVVSADASETTNDNTVTTGTQTDRFTIGDFTYTVTNVDAKTACITDMKPSDNTTKLVIPETVSYNGTTYSVTDINVDNKSAQYEKVETITIPSSVTGKLLITSTKLKDVLPEESNTLERPYLVPFPNLKKVIFLGKVAPKSIDIFSYLSYNDMIYYVPSGAEAAYEAVSSKSFSQPTVSRYDGDNGNLYQEYKVAPVIVSDARTNPEPHLFQTKYGAYVVTDNVATGKGTAALIKGKELIRRYNYKTPDSGRFIYPEWDDFTIESEVVFGSYRYTVTSMKSGALLDFKKITMLTIPDTITEMEKDSIYAGDFLNFVFFSKNCKTISDNIFNSGENGARNGIVIYVPSGVAKLEGTFKTIHINQLYLPKGISVPKNLTKASDKIVYYDKTDSTNLKNTIKISSNKVTAVIGSSLKLNAKNSNNAIKDTIHFAGMDPSIAAVSDLGVITPKHKGTTYILAFSERTGAHQLLQVTVKDATFKKGIFTYRINYSKTLEVTVISVEPSKSMKVLTIPSSVEYKGKKYLVTQICAGDYVIDEYSWYNYTPKSGFPRVYDTLVPLISDKNAKYCNITEVVMPSTIKRTVSNLGNLPNLKKIIFKGTTAPTLIALSDQNYKTATIYVPSKALAAFQKTTWRKGNYEEFVLYNGYSKESNIRLKTY